MQTALLRPQPQVSVCWMIWLNYYLFILTAGRERCAGWAGLTFNEREQHTALSIYRLVWTETLYAYRDRSQARIIFSSMSVSVNLIIVTTIKNWNPDATPGWQDAPGEEGKERHWEIRQNLAGSPESYVYIKSWGNLSYKQKVHLFLWLIYNCLVSY